ncbi:MAG: 2-phospho-L-lactate transferase CofD family protein, partial [Heliobacteriaceae bacterium]|nr:2-phospho-L-lactate transferase CofD family protein [Heliobacteriaceae bacterium]
AQEIAEAHAKKIYVSNIMTQPGETDGYSVCDHAEAVIKHAGSKKIMDAVLVNDSLPPNLAQKYEQAGSYPVKPDAECLKKLGVSVFSKKLIEDSKEGLVRHSSNRVARAIYYWYRKENRKR